MPGKELTQHSTLHSCLSTANWHARMEACLFPGSFPPLHRRSYYITSQHDIIPKLTCSFQFWIRTAPPPTQLVLGPRSGHLWRPGGGASGRGTRGTECLDPLQESLRRFRAQLLQAPRQLLRSGGGGEGGRGGGERETQFFCAGSEIGWVLACNSVASLPSHCYCHKPTGL